MCKWLLCIILTLGSWGQVQAVTFMALNAEWFWDDKQPHEGNIIQNFDSSILSKRYVETKAFAIAQLIKENHADVVALSEIENESVLELIAQYLPNNWHIVFQEGRDTYTGQDVGILTRLHVNAKTITTFPEIEGTFKDEKKRPSKVLGVALNDNHASYYIIAAHLLSKRKNSEDKDNKRAAQANAIHQAVQLKMRKYDHIVVMGDLNDTPKSTTLLEITAANTQNPILMQTANLIDNPSYSIKKYKSLIDHILVSLSLSTSCGNLKTINTGPLSDHLGVKIECK